MSLDQTLLEVEPIFRGTDGTFQFSHPSFQEILTAKQLADEINSGRLSVRDAYVNFWSYVEDKELWDLPKHREWRALLPDWKNVLLHIAGMLDSNYCNDFIQTVNKGYFEYAVTAPLQYNPFKDDFNLSLKLAMNAKEVEKIDTKKMRNHLLSNISTICDSGKYNLICLYGDFISFSCTDSTVDSISQTLINNESPNLERSMLLAARIGGESLIPSLHAYVRNTKNSNRYYAINALIEIDPEQGFLLFKRFMKNSGNPEKERQMLMYGVGQFNNKGAVSFLLDYISDKSNPFRDIAISMLGQYGTKDQEQFLIDYIKGDNHHIPSAIEALGNLGDETAAVFLVKYFERVDDTCRYVVIRALCKTKSEKAAPLLTRLLMEEDNRYIKSDILEALSEIGNKSPVPNLIRYLKGPKNNLKMAVLETLLKIDRLQAIQFIKENMDDAELSYSVLHALGELGTQKAIDFLKVYLNYEKKLSRYQAISELAQLAGESAVPYLVNSINRSKEDFPEPEIRALVSLNSERVITFLLDYVRSGGSEYWQAFNYLEEIGNKHVISCLRDMKFDQSESKDYFERQKEQTIHSIHQHLKPKGYTPPIKRLAA